MLTGDTEAARLWDDLYTAWAVITCKRCLHIEISVKSNYKCKHSIVQKTLKLTRRLGFWGTKCWKCVITATDQWSHNQFPGQVQYHQFLWTQLPLYIYIYYNKIIRLQYLLCSIMLNSGCSHTSEPQLCVQDFCLSFKELSELKLDLICPSRAYQFWVLTGSKIQNLKNSLHTAGTFFLFEPFLRILSINYYQYLSMHFTLWNVLAICAGKCFHIKG